MNNRNLPSIRHYPLEKLVEINELEIALKMTEKKLSKEHIMGIVNAFYANTQICVSGIPYIRIQGLAEILRTGNSGAEQSLVYQGIPGLISKSEILNIDGYEHISGPTLIQLIEVRKSVKSGKTKQYLQIAERIYTKIVNNSEVRDVKDVFLQEISNYRPYLKKERIDKYGISSCEFTGETFSSTEEVDFAHIDSVVTNPFRALNVDNGVIIFKHIHKDLTKNKIHNFDEMYLHCLENNYSVYWAERYAEVFPQ
ncbi:hypothetical protein [Lyngbya sp. CCY1209]|uniref:hypothetical protein n=1 Tax=Lyngbya sp. CCY1209 TaxID=2886103 RepID=UPI002D206BE8|nr:hypothetical protein [Lyngbya sp. CCY1209]MEB3882480.1 hypothetical protein [Lyngbya sp. CCY1209]